MSFKNRMAAGVALAAVVMTAALAAHAGNTNFLTENGTQVFPFTPPAPATSAPGTIDNTTIGGTTPGGGTFTSITGAPASSPFNVLGSTSQAQGFSAHMVGGASTTSANNGGNSRVIGGAPGATGNGGVGSITGGAGGATSGNGGAATATGGAATAGNGVGGAVTATGGAGQGSGAGGAASLLGGAGGATGLGGAVAVTAGTPGAGAGSDVVVTASAGVGSTNAGGNVNLVPGAAASTGAPGTVKFNGDANLMCSTYYFTGTPAATSQVFYIASRAILLTSISEIHSTAAGGTSTLDVTKDTGTAAPAGGTALGQAAFNLNATANTVQSATLVTTVATKTLAAGDRLSVKFNHAIQASAGVVITACGAPQ